MTVRTIDNLGVAISSVCIIHCVLLPVVASTLPVLGAFAENELFHKGLVVMAILPAAIAFSTMPSSKFTPIIRLLAIFGILTLFTGAFIEAFHDFETSLTIVGAISLASAHIWRTVLNRTHPHQN